MGDKRKPIVYNGFSGGLCSVNSGEICLPNQLQRAENVVIEDAGVIRQRPGVTQIDNNTVSDFIIDLFNGYVSCHDKKIYVAGATVHTYTIGGLGQFAYMSRYLHTNGIDAMVHISGITATAVLGAPLSRILHRHNDRCFCAAGAVLYETAVGTYPDSAVDNFAGGASWTIGDSGQNIVGLGSIGRNLIIFKQREIHIQIGYTKSERQTYRLTDKYGCLSPDSIKSVDLVGLGSCVVFLAHNAKLCAITLDGVVEIGDCVQDILDMIYLGTPVNEKAVSNILHRARAVVHPHGFYLLGFATTATDDDDAFDQCLCMSINYPYKSQFGTRWPFTLWKYLAQTGEMAQSWNCFGYANISTLYGYKVHIPMKLGAGSYTWGEIDYSVLTASPTATDPDGRADRTGTGAPYTYKHIFYLIQTRNEDAGVKDYLKDWAECLIRLISAWPLGSAFVPLKLTQEVDYNLVYDSPPTVYQEGLLVGGIKPRNYLIEIRHELVGGGVQTSILLERFSDAFYYDVRIHGMTILFLRSSKL
jgi:hypothetical protein